MKAAAEVSKEDKVKRVSTENPAAQPEARNVIHLENVSVQYSIPRERITSFKEYAIRLLQQKISKDDFFALRDVSFEIGRGESFGIIGRNGAGKSTLLKVIARVIRPTEGRVHLKGRIAPLLELGAGFHPELTGRENVYLNGTLLGHKRTEIDALFDEIVDFAELWDFIDAPLRTYSSGMSARLGFAVATAIRPDIFIVDEILGVGDEKFQQKCTARMEQFKKLGTSLLLVSHSSETIRQLCQRALWLERGKIRAIGDAEGIARKYAGG
jgi:ABC-type polysaccharide/polyol phosphate transport system ATPase subunit